MIVRKISSLFLGMTAALTSAHSSEYENLLTPCGTNLEDVKASFKALAKTGHDLLKSRKPDRLAKFYQLYSRYAAVQPWINEYKPVHYDNGYVSWGPKEEIQSFFMQLLNRTSRRYGKQRIKQLTEEDAWPENIKELIRQVKKQVENINTSIQQLSGSLSETESVEPQKSDHAVPANKLAAQKDEYEKNRHLLAKTIGDLLIDSVGVDFTQLHPIVCDSLGGWSYQKAYDFVNELCKDCTYTLDDNDAVCDNMDDWIRAKQNNQRGKEVMEKSSNPE